MWLYQNIYISIYKKDSSILSIHPRRTHMFSDLAIQFRSWFMHFRICSGNPNSHLLKQFKVACLLWVRFLTLKKRFMASSSIHVLPRVGLTLLARLEITMW